MDAERLERIEAVRRWRDACLIVNHGDEAAALRLAKLGSVDAMIRAADDLEPQPTADELLWCDLGGQPLDPQHPWWGHRGRSQMEKHARARGLPWPPDGDPNPYGKAK